MYLYPILKCNSLKLVTVFVSRYKISLSQIAKLCCIGIQYCIFGILSKIVNDQFVSASLDCFPVLLSCYIVHLYVAGCAMCTPENLSKSSLESFKATPKYFLSHFFPSKTCFVKQFLGIRLFQNHGTQDHKLNFSENRIPLISIL